MGRDDLARQAYAQAWADGANHEDALVAAADAVYAYDLAVIGKWLRDRAERYKQATRIALISAAEKLERGAL